MAPGIMKTPDHEAAGGLRKLRKPVIEKMRRDRINSSIEQLRLLLEKEIRRHQLPSKPEKADILEMTVTYLQRHITPAPAPTDVSASIQAQREGFSTCVQDSITFLPVQNQPDDKSMRYSGGRAVSYDPSAMMISNGNKNKPVWRPW